MGRFIKFTVLALCLMTLAIGDVTGLDTDYAQVAEDVDVMARIIDKTLEEEFPNEYKALRTGIFFGGDRDGCQGIYLEGYGAVFMIRVDFPVAEQKAPQEETTPDDLWQRTRYELRGMQGGVYGDVFASRGTGGSYDSEKVKRLKEELLKLIGTYAPNIRQLDPQENVVVAVRGVPAATQISVYSVDRRVKQSVEQEMERLKKELGKLQQQQGKVKEEAEKLKQQQNKAKEEAEKLLNEASPDEAAPTPPGSSEATGVSQVTATSANTSVAAPTPVTVPDVTTSVIVKTSGEKPEVVMKTDKVIVPGAPGKLGEAFYTTISDKDNRGRTTLIIKTSKGDITAYKDGRIDLDKFMEKAEIIQY